LERVVDLQSRNFLVLDFGGSIAQPHTFLSSHFIPRSSLTHGKPRSYHLSIHEQRDRLAQYSHEPDFHPPAWLRESRYLIRYGTNLGMTSTRRYYLF
jgi:hypothetical protein